MAEVKEDHEQEPALPGKRKSVTAKDELEQEDPKKPKTETDLSEKDVVDEGRESEEEEFEEEGESEEEDDEEEEEDEHSNGKDEIDGKGKGIMTREDKGKGKLVEVDEDSEDDSDDGCSASDDDSDLSDDPLAEVDLNNILPSRTRRKVVTPGFNLVNDGENDDDDDDSDA